LYRVRSVCLAGVALGLDLDRAAAQLHRDRAVQVRPVDAGAGGRELGERGGVGVPVVVARADADERDRRADRLEETRCVRVPAVVGDLEDRGREPVGPAEEPRLGEDLRVAGQQHRAARRPDPQHERGLVEVVGVQRARRGVQHVDLGSPEGEPLPGLEPVGRDAQVVGDGVGLVGRWRDAVVERVRPDEQRPDAGAPQDLGQPAAVVVVRVRQHDRVEMPNAEAAQVPPGVVRLRAAVDEHARGLRLAGHFDEHGVALADVEHRHRERLDRGRPRYTGQPGDHGDHDERCDGDTHEPASAAACEHERRDGDDRDGPRRPQRPGRDRGAARERPGRPQHDRQR
jgi:hypothetical protein